MKNDELISLNPKSKTLYITVVTGIKTTFDIKTWDFENSPCKNPKKEVVHVTTYLNGHFQHSESLPRMIKKEVFTKQLQTHFK